MDYNKLKDSRRFTWKCQLDCNCRTWKCLHFCQIHVQMSAYRLLSRLWCVYGVTGAIFTDIGPITVTVTVVCYSVTAGGSVTGWNMFGSCDVMMVGCGLMPSRTEYCK